jgi:hypothetical protein
MLSVSVTLFPSHYSVEDSALLLSSLGISSVFQNRKRHLSCSKRAGAGVKLEELPSFKWEEKAAPAPAEATEVKK